MPENSAASDGGAVNVCNEQEKQRNAPHAMHVKKSDSWDSGNCEHCQADFKKKTTWQRFCCKDCQTTAYELRTGKRLNFSKSENTPC